MVRFTQRGLVKFYWIPTIASAALIPTAAEVVAGTRLDVQLAEVNGFSFANQPIQTPVMSDSYTPQISGEDQADASSLKFYEDKTTNPIQTALAKGVIGFVVIFFLGTAGAAPAAGDKSDVWPSDVSSNVRGYSAGNEASQYTVNFAITAPPGFNKTLT